MKYVVILFLSLHGRRDVKTYKFSYLPTAQGVHPHCPYLYSGLQADRWKLDSLHLDSTFLKDTLTDINH